MKIEAGMTSAEKLAVIEWHAEQDMLISGTYGYTHDDGVFRGCSIGCVVGGRVNYNEHEHWSQLIGAPKIIGLVIDSIFEGLPAAERPAWHVNVHRAVLAAVDRGADLSLIAHQHTSRALSRCLSYIGNGDEPWRVECRRVVEMARDATAAGRWLTDGEAAEAADAARAADTAGAMDASWAAAVADTSWAARAAGAAGKDERQAQADDLIRLLEEA